MENQTFNIEELPVTIAYVAETNRDGWACDQWRVTIKTKAGVWVEDYFTGLGLRTKPKQSWVEPKPVKPSIADVMRALTLDASAINESFSDWCDNYGYEDDSITAFEIYRKCCATGKNMRKHFTPEQREQIKTITQDM